MVLAQEKKLRYQAHSSNLSGRHGWPHRRCRSGTLTNSGTSSARSPQRKVSRDHQRQHEKLALWMAARAGDTEKCRQLLAARADVNVEVEDWVPLMTEAELEHGGVVCSCCNTRPTYIQQTRMSARRQVLQLLPVFMVRMEESHPALSLTI